MEGLSKQITGNDHTISSCMEEFPVKFLSEVELKAEVHDARRER